MANASAASTKVAAAAAATRMIAIGGIDKAHLATALLVGAKLSPVSLLKPQLPTDVSQGMANNLSLTGPIIGWYCGRALMFDISGDQMDPTDYDRYNGTGAARRAVRRARSVKRTPKASETVGYLYEVQIDGWQLISNDPQGVCARADVHYTEHGVAETRVVGFGRVAGHRPTFWMRAVGADMSRFVWQAVGRGVTCNGVQAMIDLFVLGGPDPGEVQGSYSQPTTAYDPHVTLFPGRTRGSWKGDYQRWAPIDRILEVATFDVIPSILDADCMYLCLRHFVDAYGQEFVSDPREELGGSSLLGEYQDATRIEDRDASALAVLRVLMVASRLVVEGLKD